MVVTQGYPHPNQVNTLCYIADVTEVMDLKIGRLQWVMYAGTI
jgi:hypothetical protein